MKGFKKAFTLVEVSLFLALSGFLMIGLIIGANMSISRQRYNDTVNSFAEFIRGVYSDVLNVSNDKVPSSKEDGEDAGRTGKAVYGKLIVIGDPGTAPSEIYTYDVVGKAVNSSEITGENTLQDLISLGINIAYLDSVNKNIPYKETRYILPWDGVIEASNSNNLRRDAILIVRSPSSGSIVTYSLNPSASPTPNLAFRAAFAGAADARNRFTQLLSNFQSNQNIDLCVDSPDNTNKFRRDVRINAGANNSSFVEEVALDNETENKCKDSAGRPGDVIMEGE